MVVADRQSKQLMYFFYRLIAYNELPEVSLILSREYHSAMLITFQKYL